MIRRPPRSTPLSLHDALPISAAIGAASTGRTHDRTRPMRHHQSPLAPKGIGDAASVGCGHVRSEEHTSELQSQSNLVCRLLLEKKTEPSVRNVSCLRLSTSSI